MKELIIAWQDPVTRKWIPVGRLKFTNGEYYFVYTEGARSSPNFVPFGRMQDLGSVYVSQELLPLFANRILSKSRPEYSDYIRWLGLEDGDVSHIEMLARTRGQRATDTLEIFPCPSPDEMGNYAGYFFAHGLRYLLPESLQRIAKLEPDDRLFLALDVQNVHDPSAILLRTADPTGFVGYCPRYLAAGFGHLVQRVGPDKVVVRVARVNVDAPNEMRLLCRIETPWPKDFAPCSTGNYQPIGDIDSVLRKRAAEEKSEPESLG